MLIVNNIRILKESRLRIDLRFVVDYGIIELRMIRLPTLVFIISEYKNHSFLFKRFVEKKNNR